MESLMSKISLDIGYGHVRSGIDDGFEHYKIGPWLENSTDQFKVNELNMNIDFKKALVNIKNIYDNIRSQKAWPRTDFQPDGGQGLRTIFAKALEETESEIKTMPTELDSVQTAMAMENKTYDFYKSQSKMATYDVERDFYDALATQEGEHYRILLDYYEFLKDPAAWFVQKEHPSLDGG